MTLKNSGVLENNKTKLKIICILIETTIILNNIVCGDDTFGWHISPFGILCPSNCNESQLW